MAKRTSATVEQSEGGAALRRCIGSAKYGIEPHDAPAEDFPAQPSQKHGLGRMCKVHWRAYTASLARDAKARKTTPEAESPASVEPRAPRAETPKPRGRKREVVLVRTADAPGVTD